MSDNVAAENIWIISKYALSKKYGFESRQFALSKEFLAKGRNPVIISSDSNHFGSFPEFGNLYNFEDIDDISVCWIKTFKYKKTISLRRIISWIDFEIKLFFMPKRRLIRPDVIIVSSLSLLTIINGFILAKKYKCKLIFEIRDIWPLTLTAEGGFSRYNPFVMGLAWIEKFGYKKSDLNVGTMPNLTEHIKKVTGRNLPCTSVPFGFDPDFFKNEEPLEDEKINEITSGKFVVGYAGSMGLTNALDTIIECAKRMSGNREILFLFLGDGDMRQKYISETEMLDNVIFVPKVKRMQVQSVLKLCNILYFAVLDSPVWDYGMSLNKLIDYMMAGKPIIASYSGYPSMINEADCGEFIPSGDVDKLIDKIKEYAAKQPVTLEEMGKRGREWLIKNRTWGAVAEEYLRQCDMLIQK